MNVETYSIKGRLSYENEDFLLWDRFDDGRIIAVVADGMGGLDAGALAARTASEAIVSFVKEHCSNCAPDMILSDSMFAADAALSKIRRDFLVNLGTSITAAIVGDADIWFTWLGNVRIYKVHVGRIIQLTQDHTIDVGYSNVRLTRCLKGLGIKGTLPVMHESLSDDDSILIGTDGLYGNDTLTFMEKVNALISGNLVPDDDATLLSIKIL